MKVWDLWDGGVWALERTSIDIPPSVKNPIWSDLAHCLNDAPDGAFWNSQSGRFNSKEAYSLGTCGDSLPRSTIGVGFGKSTLILVSSTFFG